LSNSGIPLYDSLEENRYYLEMATGHKLTPKLEAVIMLRSHLDRLIDDWEYRPELGEDDRKWASIGPTGQIFALSMELTDDLAFVCDGYLKCIANHDKKLVEYIANASREDAVRFYDQISGDSDAALEAVGLDPSDSSDFDKSRYSSEFSYIREMRLRHWQWYNGYKHGQYATPMVVVPGGEPGLRRKWGLYLIPKRPLRDSSGMINLEGKTRFLETVWGVDQFVDLAQIAVCLWAEVRDRQYVKVFGHPPEPVDLTFLLKDVEPFRP